MVRDQEQDGPEREVVILMSDMVGYSQVTAHMRPDEVRDFIIHYHQVIYQLVGQPEAEPVEIEPLAGDGALMVFERLPGEERAEVCTRALRAALRVAHAVAEGKLQATRMGLYLGDIIEASLGARKVKFGSSFAVATRLEELCDYFGTCLLMDREVAENQSGDDRYLVSVGKVMLKSFSHPVHVYSVYEPGLQNLPHDVDTELLNRYVQLRNEAMLLFCGNSPLGITPNFPKVREMLAEAQELFVEMTGREDKSSDRILEYIRETPLPDEQFFTNGMTLSEKKRDTLGSKLFHLSSELLKAMNHEFYHALVVDTGWEKHFKLEWRKKGEHIITIHDLPDGVYFIDRGEVVTLNEDGEEIAILSAGTIFGEMAYFSEEKRRTATVVAKTDVVIRRITSEDFQKLPVIMKIFERIAMARR
ncbi:cyclic nucleotide-binding domain-containing protein [Desulfopila aestuarii]|uniref:Adenylate cyclase, class 3 n=1 Tax=Desulfopila aestuarii DSM 18488 TaxID=1121416 RepID=A0A1M7XWB5_9BACT|nr:cyclic nucleotide-binding domain-containing protein [Desulfopila aestuarii]SHO43032.1 Adenylate cyclase, class 3 [Desulfopila aestuarii DSM 18488]